jgi:protein TonB
VCSTPVSRYATAEKRLTRAILSRIKYIADGCRNASVDATMFESMFEYKAIRAGRSAHGPALSFAIHCGIAALLLMAGTSPAVRKALRPTMNAVPLIAPYVSAVHSTGGGGGGDRSPLPASRGRLPKIALRQFTPPMVVLNNTNPKLAMEPTLILSAEVSLPQMNPAELGDPFGGLGPKSNGPGSGGGIGTGVGTGVGPGKGPGLGPGVGGNVSLRGVGGATSSPVLLFKVEPEFSEQARQAKHQGVVILYGEVDTSGRLTNVRVVQGLGLGLDEKAMEAVKQWKFRPGYQNGRPVTAAATIEVNFHLL